VKSFSGNSAYDYCNRQGNASSLVRILYREP